MYDAGELVDFEIVRNNRTETGLNLPGRTVGAVGTVGIPTDDSGRAVVVGTLSPCRGERPPTGTGGEVPIEPSKTNLPTDDQP